MSEREREREDGQRDKVMLGVEQIDDLINRLHRQPFILFFLLWTHRHDSPLIYLAPSLQELGTEDTDGCGLEVGLKRR